MQTEIDILLGFNRELRILVESIFDVHPHPNGLKQGHALLALGKAYKTHGAILLLCENGYGEDATILARSLLELSLGAMFIAQDRTDATAKRYFEYDYVIRYKMYKYLLSNDDLKDELQKRIEASGNQDAKIEEIEKKAKAVLSGYSKEEKRRNNWSGKTIKEIAVIVGQEDLYKTAYSLQCNLAHSDASIANNYITEENGQSVMDISPNNNWISETLVISTHSFLAIIKNWNSLFDHGLDKSLTDFEGRFVDEMEKINKRRS